MNDDPTIKRTYGNSEVTITFKGSNPTIKDDVLNMLCDGFEDRVINDPEPEKSESESIVVEAAEHKAVSERKNAHIPEPTVHKRKRPRAR